MKVETSSPTYPATWCVKVSGTEAKELRRVLALLSMEQKKK
jgi:hypothetical protein